MKKNHGLVPTPVTDKNGKQTTVYKKPQKGAVAASLPSPALSPQKDMKATQIAVTERIRELYDTTHESGFDYTPHLWKEVQRYSDNTLRNVELAIQNDGDLAQGVAQHIVHGEVEQIVNETIHFYRKTNSSDYWRTATNVRALGNYPTLSMHDDLSAVDEATEKQCLALMEFSRLIDTLPESPSPFLDYVDWENHDMRIIKDQSLVDLVANRPDDAAKIAEVVLKYRTSDSATINGILEGAFPTLAEGQL